MPTIHNTLALPAAPEVVFDLMADPRRYPQWVAIVEDAALVTGDEIEEGAEYTEVSPLGPIRSTSHWRVTTFDRPHRQVHAGRLPFGPVERTIDIQPDGEGTRLNHTVEITALPQFRPLGRVLERLLLVGPLENDLTKSLVTFAKLAEAESKFRS